MKKIFILSLCLVAFLIFQNYFATATSISPLNPETQSSHPFRVAVVGFIGASTQAVESTLSDALKHDERVKLLDETQSKPALKAFGYDGSINLDIETAKHLGAAIGCDFFIVGKTDSATRSERAGETHEETFIGIMVIDARSGGLTLFDFILEKAAKKIDAQNAALQTLSQQVGIYLEKLIAFRRVQETSAVSESEIAEDLPATEPATEADFKPPEFLNRVKPEFTQEADRADLNATVEARVVFRASGEIGEIQIIRWAGFGLEESAIRAIRQLKFKPATRNHQAINVRALIRYNFRRINQN
ncbi:MAG: energy transducer TonB [Acidobacteriota bacterium]